MGTKEPKNILIAPLDWGLGHTTRCVPLIRYLQQQGHHPIVAGNASQRSFISQTFADSIDTVHLEGYNVTYSKVNRVAHLGLLTQLPSIAATVAHEHQWLEAMAVELHLDGIISDNRYGLFHKDIPSVIITHQLQVLSGLGGIADRAVQRMHYRYLERFNGVWVADTGATTNLAEKLSHPDALPKNTQYIGLLSRFRNELADGTSDDHAPLVILLSGPEPQRSDLSAILWQQAADHKGKIVFIEGSDTASTPTEIPNHIAYHKRLAGEQLEPVLAGSGMIISRSGYSTIMDLVALGKKAILIPTPGQTEQQYLADRLQTQGAFYSAPQKGFDLQQALTEAHKFPWHPIALQDDYTHHKTVMDNWLGSL